MAAEKTSANNEPKAHRCATDEGNCWKKCMTVFASNSEMAQSIQKGQVVSNRKKSGVAPALLLISHASEAQPAQIKNQF
jgi:hypothetical protein